MQDLKAHRTIYASAEVHPVADPGVVPNAGAYSYITSIGISSIPFREYLVSLLLILYFFYIVFIYSQPNFLCSLLDKSNSSPLLLPPPAWSGPISGVGAGWSQSAHSSLMSFPFLVHSITLIVFLLLSFCPLSRSPIP